MVPSPRTYCGEPLSARVIWPPAAVGTVRLPMVSVTLTAPAAGSVTGTGFRQRSTDGSPGRRLSFLNFSGGYQPRSVSCFSR